MFTKHDSEMFFSSFPFWLSFSHILVHLSSHRTSSCHLRERSFNWITTAESLGKRASTESNRDEFISWRFPIWRVLVPVAVTVDEIWERTDGKYDKLRYQGFRGVTLEGTSKMMSCVLKYSPLTKNITKVKEIISLIKKLTKYWRYILATPYLT